MDDVTRIVAVDGNPPHSGNSCQDGLPLALVGFALLQKLGMLEPRQNGDWTHWTLKPELQALDKDAFLAEIVKRDNQDQMSFALDVWQEIADEQGWGPR